MSNIGEFHSSDERQVVSSRTKLFLSKVNTKSEKDIYYGIVEKFHSYVPQRNVVGRHIGWLILLDNEPIGCIGISSYFLPEPKALKEFIGWDKERFNKNFNSVAVNWRFTFMPNAPKNVGSQVLSLLAKVAPKEWKSKYGNELVLLVSLVGAGKRGVVYKAAGWKEIGMTAGSTAHDSFSVSKEWAEKKNFKYGGSYKRSKKEQKIIFVKSLIPNWKDILNKV